MEEINFDIFWDTLWISRKFSGKIELILIVKNVTKKSFTLSSDNVSFKPLIYCFKETVEYDVKALFARHRVSCLIKPDDIIKEF